MRRFQMDPRLVRDTAAVAMLGLCELRLMNDSRWPWLLLVPRRGDITEFHHLTPLDQTMLTFETAHVCKALKETTGADKLNIGALGNVVPMFHLHVVARFSSDPNWPGPVWGFGAARAYEPDALETLVGRLQAAVLPA